MTSGKVSEYMLVGFWWTLGVRIMGLVNYTLYCEPFEVIR